MRKQDVQSPSGHYHIKAHYEHQAHVLLIFTVFSWLWLCGSPTSCFIAVLLKASHLSSSHQTLNHLNLIFSSPSHFVTQLFVRPQSTLPSSPSEQDGLSADTKETSGWCHVVWLLFQNWHQMGGKREISSFFPEYDPKYLAPLTEPLLLQLPLSVLEHRCLFSQQQKLPLSSQISRAGVFT